MARVILVELILYFLFGLITFASIKRFKASSDCAPPINILFVSQAVLMDLILISGTFVFRSERFCCDVILILEILILHLSFIAGLVFLIWLTIKTPSCINIPTRSTAWIIYGITNFYMIIGILSLLYYGYLAWREKQKQIYFNKIIARIYAGKISKKFKIENFLRKYKEDLDENEILSRNELDHLFNSFTVLCNIEQIKLPEEIRNTCVICFNEYQIRDVVLIHPKCGHLFHFDCIKIWFEIGTSCPTCKVNTKKGMLYDLVKRRQRNFNIRYNAALNKKYFAKQISF